MMGVWEITNFNAATIEYRPHNDYGAYTTGLVEGFHVLRARAFLQRDGSACGNGRRASIYNTFVQPFYFDASTPTGEIMYPPRTTTTTECRSTALVVRTDPTVREVWYNIAGQRRGERRRGRPACPTATARTARADGVGQGGTRCPPRASRACIRSEWRFTYRNIPAAGSSTIRVKLCELSSSTNLNLTDSAGHFTTLQRLADARSPTQELYVAYPSSDADQVNDQWDYVMKAWFSKSLDSSTTNFVIRINGSAQAQSDYSIHYDVDGTHHELAFTLPDLFNGDSNFVHHIEVVYTSNGGVQYEAHRYIRVYSQASGPYVSIVSPPEVDSDGQPFVIVLPDVGSPTAEQRQYPIRVDTDLSGSNVWIEFNDNAGVAIRPPSVETPIGGVVDVALNTNLVVGRERALTGTVSVNFSNNLVTGTGSAFTNELRAGHRVRISTNSVAVTQVVSSTQFYIDPPYPGPSVTNVAAAAVPSFDTELQVGSAIRISSNALAVSQILSATNLTLTAAYPGTTATGLTAYRVDGNPSDRRQPAALELPVDEHDGRLLHVPRARGHQRQHEHGRGQRHAQRDRGLPRGRDEQPERRGRRRRRPLRQQRGDADQPAGQQHRETGTTARSTSGTSTARPTRCCPDTDGDGLPDGLEVRLARGRSARRRRTPTRTPTATAGRTSSRDLDPPFYNTLDNHTDGGTRAPSRREEPDGGRRPRRSSSAAT